MRQAWRQRRATSTRSSSSAARRACRRCRTGQGALRQGAEQERQPRRGRGDRRGHSGRGARGRGEGPPAARRHAAVARHRDPGRRDDALIAANTTIPTQEAEVFSTAADSQTGSRSTCCRASGPWRATTARSAASPGRHPAGAARACRRSRSPSTSTPTASSTCPRGTRPREGAEHHDHGLLRPVQGRDRPHEEGGRGSRRRRRQALRGDRAAQPGRLAGVLHRADAARPRRQGAVAADKQAIEAAIARRCGRRSRETTSGGSSGRRRA